MAIVTAVICVFVLHILIVDIWFRLDLMLSMSHFSGLLGSHSQITTVTYFSNRNPFLQASEKH